MWNVMLMAWIANTIDYWNMRDNGEIEDDPETVQQMITDFMDIVAYGMKEYEDRPPDKYYKDGFNLCKRLAEKPEDYYLCLLDPRVEPSNNVCERLARVWKRKARQVMAFRSDKGVSYYCAGMSIIQSLKNQEVNLFDELTLRFNMGLGV